MYNQIENLLSSKLQKMASVHKAAGGFHSIDDNGNQAPTNEWIRFGMRLAISATLHPYEYAKVLIQLGYEPIAPVPGLSLFGKPIKTLPNIFQYASYIRSVDGFFGCYRGLTPKLLGSFVGLFGSEKIADYFGLNSYKKHNKGTEEDLYIQFKVHLKRDIVVTASGIILSYPFHVICLRMMSQFIGRETLYDSLITSIMEIYKNDGLEGFFAGLLPKLICDVGCVILTSSTVFLLNKYMIKDKIGRQYFAALTQFTFGNLLYPLELISTCMAVTGSRLKAGRPPNMPEYENWIDCWNDLRARNDLKRGGSFFWRSVTSTSKNRFAEYPSLQTLVKYY